MKIELTFRDSEARIIKMYLRKLYNSKAELPRLIKMAVRHETETQAARELTELYNAAVAASTNDAMETGDDYPI